MGRVWEGLGEVKGPAAALAILHKAMWRMVCAWRARIDTLALLAYSSLHRIPTKGGSNVRVSLLRAIALLAIAGLLLPGCGGSGPTPAPSPTATQVPEAFDLVILHTNDVRGFTEPCG